MSHPSQNISIDLKAGREFSETVRAGGMPIAATPLRPPGLSASPDVYGLLIALQRRWRLASIVGALIAMIASAATYCLIPRSKYTARATLHVSSNPKYIIFDPKERLADYRTYQRTQVALTKSRFVMMDALKKPGIAELATTREHSDPSEWLSQQINIGFPDASEVLEISLSGDRPADLSALVNAVVESYQDLVVDQEQEERRARLERLRSLWERYQKSLQSKRSTLRDLSDTIGSNDKQVLTMTHQTKIQHREVAEQEQMRVKFELKKAESELAVLESHVDEAEEEIPHPSLIDERIDAAPAVLELQRYISKLAKNFDAVSRLARDRSDPALIEAKRQLDAGRKELAALRAKLRPEIVARIRMAATRDDVSNVQRLRDQVRMARMYKEEIDKELGRVQEETKSINRGSQDLSQQQDEIQIISDTARKIGAEVEAMEVELGAPPRIRLVDRATVPAAKDSLRKAKMSGGAAAGSFVFALVGVSFWEFRARRINNIEQVVNGLGMRLVGALPALPDWSRRHDEAQERRIRSILVESIDATRTMILHASLSENIRIIMITSAEKGEGKTSLSCHLATSLARTGRRILLVDGDLRCPSAHLLFDVSAARGLSEVLRGEALIDDVIQETPAGGVHLMPAGECDAVAVQALSQDRIRDLFRDLGRRYDFVIVDSAPVLPVADSLLLGQVVDAVIFSILRDVSRVPSVYAAYERLATLGVRIFGAVVSGAPGENCRGDYQYATKARA